MESRYRSLFNLEFSNILYTSIIDDDDRTIITRWRLSSHKLYIETGRYKIPKIERNLRICKSCRVLEDEHHALFICNAHYSIRLKFIELLRQVSTVPDLLTPKDADSIIATTKYIRSIEKNMGTLDMFH